MLLNGKDKIGKKTTKQKLKMTTTNNCFDNDPNLRRHKEIKER